jgi:hypothetical protein
VRFVAGRPRIIKPPTAMTEWDGLPFVVEWEGRAITVFIAREAMNDLGGFRKRHPDVAYIEVFAKHRGSILDDLARVLTARKATETPRPRTGRQTLSLRQLVEQGPGLFQVKRVEALGERVVEVADCEGRSSGLATAAAFSLPCILLRSSDRYRYQA